MKTTVKLGMEKDPWTTKLTLNGHAVRVQIAGARSHGWELGAVPEGEEARQVTGGPMVAGPWMYAVALAGVIAANGRGTKWEIDQAREQGYLLELEAGDIVEWGGRQWQARLERNEFLSFDEVGLIGGADR